MQAPVIKMSQNRAQKTQRPRADVDDRVHRKSDFMLQQRHVTIDELRATDLDQTESTLQEHAALKRRTGDPERTAEDTE